MAQTATTTTPFPSASLYVGDLAPEVSEGLLFEIFNAVGPVASLRVCRDAATRRSLGYAYVNFHRFEDAERALDILNFTNIRNRPCRIMWSHRDPSLRKSGAGNIFVKNLAKTIDNKTLYDTFSAFGNILSCKVSMNSKRESLGYGFVHYENEEAARNAIERVNGMIIADRQVVVQPFKSKKDRGAFDKSKFTNVYVKNLPEDLDKNELDTLFGRFGEITSSMASFNDDGKSRGFGFVNFANADQATAAVETLNGSELRGRKLYVARAQKREERERELRDRFEQLKTERQKKYAGVNLYIKNLGDGIDDDRLRTEFAKFGDITSSRVMRDAGNKSRGFGFVCFTTPEEATKAVTEMNGKMVENKPLYVALAQRKEVRRAQLEAQYAARGNKMGGGMPQQMGFPQGAPMGFYPPQGMPPRMMYPPQHMGGGGGGMPRGRWPQAQGGRQMIVPPMGYMTMPQGAQGAPGNVANGGRGGGRGAGRPQAGRQNPQAQGGRGQQNYKFTTQVRNSRDVANSVAQNASSNVTGTPQPLLLSTQAPLTIQDLARAPEDQQKQMIGERLFPLIQQVQPDLAGKITGMLLEMDNGELLHLLESADARSEKIQEALTVLNSQEAAASAENAQQ